ncbi:hypothetical protein BD779DRAFT_1568674 [Infundibulicybe gibba]|nr:hypothetical protein BD779DRAFT_1568674 [Infundibulicybe gibba]
MGPNSIAILSIVAFITSEHAPYSHRDTYRSGDVTLYNVVGPNPPIYSEIDNFSALALQPEGTTTRTLLSTPTTFVATVVEDKTGFNDPDGLIYCTFVPGGEGTCVGKGVTIESGGGAPSSVDPASLGPYTIIGSATPWTTIKDPGPTAAPTTTVAAPTATAASANGAGALRFPSILTAICLSVMYLLL